MPNRTVAIIDKRNLVHRFFHGLRPDGRTPFDDSNRCLWGFARKVFEMRSKGLADVLVVADDIPHGNAVNVRKAYYPEYKATRGPTPEALVSQEADIDAFLELAGIPRLSHDGYEADDVIGTLAELSKTAGDRAFVLSSDKDLLQLVDSGVFVYDELKKKLFHPGNVSEKFGVPAGLIVDYLSITGDSSDNVPGIPWIWPVGALKLVGSFGTLESIYENADSPTVSGRERSALERGRESAFLSKKLVTIERRLPISVPDVPDFSKSAFPAVAFEFLESRGLRFPRR